MSLRMLRQHHVNYTVWSCHYSTNMWCAENMAGEKKTSETQNTTCEMTKLYFLIHLCWNCCADVPLIQLLCGASFFVSWNKQYAHRTLSPPGKTFRWWPSSPVFRLQVRHWASWFFQQGRKQSRPWIQSRLRQQESQETGPGKPRRRPCRPRSDPILQGFNIGPVNKIT